jgi:hypothetical protein
MILPSGLLFGRKRKLQVGRENCVMWSFMMCAPHQMLWYLQLSGQAYDNVGDEECIGDVGGEA